MDMDLQTNIDIAKDAHTWYLSTMSFEEKAEACPDPRAIFSTNPDRL